MKNLKKIVLTLTLCVSFLSSAQNTNTFCPNKKFGIKLILSFEYYDNKTSIFLEKEYKSISEMLVDKKLDSFNWVVSFKKAISKNKCFSMKFPKDSKTLFYDRKIKIVHVKYFSNEDYKNQVYIKYYTKNGSTNARIRNKNDNKKW